jgi:(p)ppGpp synthase/HD superfamily hydrolase
MFQTNLVLKAIKFATEKHQGQLRKVSGDEYITHPISVSYLVAIYKKSKHLDELISAAYLHDTLEDTKTTFLELSTEFTPLTASLVKELTSDANEINKIGKLVYLQKKMVAMSSYSLVIKLCDRLHNISDNPTDKMLDDTTQLLVYLEKNRKLTNTHKELVKAIRTEINKKRKNQTRVIMTKKTIYIAFRRIETISEPSLLNYIISKLAENDYDIAMLPDDYTKSVVPLWFSKHTKGNGSLTFVDASNLHVGTYFIHNYDDVLPNIPKNSKIVKINATDPLHINIQNKDGYVDFCASEILTKLIS